MNRNRFGRLWIVCLVATLALGGTWGSQAAGTNLYNADFEFPRFDSSFDLDTQDGWIVSGTGGTGVFVDGVFSGQSAFVGIFPPTNTNSETTAWIPIPVDPVSLGFPRITASVDFVVWTSTPAAPQADEFRWSVVNRQDQPLFELIFDSLNGKVFYQLNDGSPATNTLQTFATNVAHRLTVRMDFLSNRWSASLSNHVTHLTTTLVTDQPISAGAAAATFGDMDASWVIIDPLLPGDNLMEFDNYTIAGEGPGAFVLNPPQRDPQGGVQVTLNGESGNWFILESLNALSTSSSSWTAVATNQAVQGVVNFKDASAQQLAQRFYRARWRP